MGDMHKECQLKLIEEEKPAAENIACREANSEKSVKPRRDRSSKFCYQPGELKLSKKQQ